jgi:hypothetical protein
MVSFPLVAKQRGGKEGGEFMNTKKKKKGGKIIPGNGLILFFRNFSV